MSARQAFARNVVSMRGHPSAVRVKPTEADVEIARTIAHHTTPVREEIAKGLTWGADEKVLLVLAATGWLASRGGGEQLRRAGNHALLVTLASSLLPHGIKLMFDQTRPYRKTVLSHVHGISFSGKRDDAVLGAVLERLLRPWTGYAPEPLKEKKDADR